LVLSGLVRDPRGGSVLDPIRHCFPAEAFIFSSRLYLLVLPVGSGHSGSDSADHYLH
jgi:hypothetical protein